MELNQEEYKISRTICQGSARTYSSGDIIVPDTQPDVLKIIQVDASSAIDGKQIKNGKIILSGQVTLKILYVPESNEKKICSINTAFDFSEEINCKNASDDMFVTAASNVSNVEFSVVNSRKLRIRASVVLDYEVTDISNVAIACKICCDTAEIKTDSIDINNVCDVLDHRFILQEDFELPHGQPPINEFLKCETQITDTEYKAINGRIVIKGMLVICILYLDDDKNPETAEIETPFTEIIDSDNVTDDSVCDIEYDILNVFCDTAEDSDGDIRVIKTETQIQVQVKIIEKESIRIIKDCYIPGMDIDIKTETFSIEETVANPSVQNTVRETAEISNDTANVKNVYNVVMKPYLTKIETADGRVICGGKIEAYILYLSDNSDMPVCSTKKEIPFSYAIEDPNVTEGLTVRVSAEIKHSGYTLNSAGEAELRCILSLDARVTKKREETIVTAIEEHERKDSDSGIVIYYVQNGDTLWDIAKSYAVPQDKIKSYNALETDTLKAGEKLFIPNYCCTN